MKPRHVERGGAYYRVCDPAWSDPSDTSYSRLYGGRWNPPGAFGALYLCADLAVAAANARRSLALAFGDAVAFADLRPERRPDLQSFAVATTRFADAASAKGLAALGLPAEYPQGATHARCQAIARELEEAGEAGVAARSAALPVGEELAIFDSHRRLARRKRGARIAFASWYPGLI